MRLGIEPDIQIVGEAEHGEEALSLAALLRPDVIVMDLEMPRLGGIEAAERLCASGSDSRIIILSLHDDQHSRARADAAGCWRFVAKHEADRLLLPAIRDGGGAAKTLG
jgi:DNA-binding NarL/FixJ family response regulator